MPRAVDCSRFALVLIAPLIAASVGCDKSDVRKAGNDVQRAAEKTGSAIDRGLDQTGQAVNQGMNRANDAVNDNAPAARDAASHAGHDLGVLGRRAVDAGQRVSDTVSGAIDPATTRPAGG